MVPTPTDGELASAVFCRPCTIQGCRPFSVRIQPAVLTRNGSGSDQTASRRNHGELVSRLRIHSPHSDNSRIRLPR